MKLMIFLLAALIMTGPAIAQTVNINVNGTQNEQVIVNGISYKIDNSVNITKTITINTLRPGKYALEVVRINNDNPNDPNNNNQNNNLVRTKNTTPFTVKEGYDVAILVAPNGTVQVKEKKIAESDVIRAPMPDDVFLTVLHNVQNEWRNTRKITAAQTAFTNNNNYFTSAQARQIIQSVTGDAHRLTLAKLAFNRITDQGNFLQVYNLMSTQPIRDDLVAYVKTQGSNLIMSFSETYLPQMSDHNFNALVQSIDRQWHTTARANAVTEVFANQTNYFTTAQVRRLIELVDFESGRLQLLKSAYHHVTDPAQFPLLYKLLATDAARAELEDYVNAATLNGGLVNYNLNRIAMNDDDFATVFNTSLQRVRENIGLQHLNNVFADISNYFTSQQASKLISVMEGEMNRLSLAKAAYRSITDPENFLPMMNQLLALESSREELNDYAFSYRGK